MRRDGGEEGEDTCLKVLAVEVQIATSSRFPTTVGFFFLRLLANRVILKAIARWEVERIFFVIQFFSHVRSDLSLT